MKQDILYKGFWLTVKSRTLYSLLHDTFLMEPCEYVYLTFFSQLFQLQILFLTPLHCLPKLANITTHNRDSEVQVV